MDAQMIKTLQDYFATQPVLKAWVFGSFARGEETEDSEVDLVEDGTLKPYALQSADHDKIMVYER